ncbi:hypothetical protein ABZW10_13350 [Kitasatospora sp. NPDC004723]|uniref:hypothetical protein n=1 Tax=Kitasatospora sp. NPDC004723 TaxID=3154288 RepID=UPI0033B237C1
MHDVTELITAIGSTAAGLAALITAVLAARRNTGHDRTQPHDDASAQPEQDE